jgi:hypothetical protein
MREIKDNYNNQYGYFPTDAEILSLYLLGELKINDKQENELLRYFNL